MANKLVCLVGMCGAGKSEVADYLMLKGNFQYVRFGQITMDKIKEMGKEPSEKLEREVREKIRADHGMAGFAILNMPKIDEMLKTGDVIGDGLYSWEEYLELKKKYGSSLVVVAVYTAPKIRYERLKDRARRHIDDLAVKYRNFTQKESASRDVAEIENLHKAGPIAMADYTVINNGLLAEAYNQLDEVWSDIFKR